MLKRILVLIIVFVFGALNWVEAELIEKDLFTIGDGLITYDTETRIEWLDVTQTLSLTYNQIESDEQGWISMGFRHATFMEVFNLFSTYGFPLTYSEYIVEYSTIGSTQQLRDLLGETYNFSGLGSCRWS